MPDEKKTTSYSTEQLEQLSGGYKHSDNTMSIEKNETNNVNEGDGISTKRPQ